MKNKSRWIVIILFAALAIHGYSKGLFSFSRHVEEGDPRKKSHIINKKSDMLQVDSLQDRMFCWIHMLFSRKQDRGPRQQGAAVFKQYSERLSEEEKQDLYFVVSSAAEKSALALAGAKGEIRESLLRLQSVHPLALLEAIEKDPKLIEGMRKIQSRGWIWNLLVSELNGLFSAAYNQGIISADDVSGFSSSTGMDSSTVSTLVEGGRWLELINQIVGCHT